MQPEKIHEIINNKYENLLWTIARRISGDNVATTSLEDNFQDLWLAAFEAVEGFTKQNNYSNGPVEDWIETKPFDKYLKTCLWNRKNHRGKQIANKYAIHRDTVPTDLEQVLNVSSGSFASFSNVFCAEMVTLTENERGLVSSLVSDPNRYFTEKGKIKVSPLQRCLGWERNRVIECLNSIKKKMGNGLI